MAQSVATMTENIRVALVDVEDHRFSDANILLFLNKAYRKVYGMFAKHRPEMVKTIKSGNTVAGTDEYAITSGSIQRVLSLHVDELPLPDIGQRPEGDYENTEYGFPKGFFVSAWDKVTMVPAPDDAYAYRLAYVAAPAALTTGSTTWPDVFDDLMEEFTVMRLGIIDEGDPSMEGQFMADLERRAMELLDELGPHADTVASYWETPAYRSGY